MRRVLAIASLNLRSLVRDRTELVSVIVLPLVLTWVFGTAFGSQGAEAQLAIPVADKDGSTISERFVATIGDSVAFDVTAMSETDARALVRAGDAPVAIVVPEGFGDRVAATDGPVPVQAIVDPSSQRARAALEVVQGAAVRMSADRAAVDAVGDAFWSRVEGRTIFGRDREEILLAADEYWEPVPPVAVKAKSVRLSGTRAQELEAPANTQYSLGFTVFFVFMVALGSAGGVLEERELGTLRRLLAAPMHRAEILAGKVLGVALVATFEAALLVGFGAIVFGVPWGSDPLAVALVLVALVFASTGIGVMLSALVRTRSQMSAIGPVLSTGLAMLGGCYWPIEVASPFMQQLARFTPTGWAMIGLKDVVARGLGVEAVVAPVGVLLGFAVLSLAIGVTRLRLE